MSEEEPTHTLTFDQAVKCTMYQQVSPGHSFLYLKVFAYYTKRPRRLLPSWVLRHGMSIHRILNSLHGLVHTKTQF